MQTPLIKVSCIFYRKPFPGSKLTDSPLCFRDTEIVYIKIEPGSILLPVKRRIRKPPETNNNTATVCNSSNNDDEIDKIIHDLEQYICDFCNVSFTSKADLTEHISLYKFSCDICSQHFQFMPQLKVHYSSNHGPETFPCTKCDYVCKSMSTLQYHFVMNHANEKNYQCELCLKNFKHKTDLSLHRSRVHSGNSRTCEICGHRSVSFQALKSHMRFIHHKSGKSPDFGEKCTTCGKQFKERGALRIHMRVHSGSRPFECVICNNNFSRQASYEQHVLTHMEKKMYPCDVCGRDFTQKSGLIFHRKRHKGDLPPLATVSVKKVVEDFIANFLRERRHSSPDSNFYQ